jgi:two-component system OmpR family sensor kinase
MNSIRRQLLISLIAVLLAGFGLAGWLTFRQARAEANELFDFQLQQTAAALPSEPFSSAFGAGDPESGGVVIQIWSREGVQLYYSHPRAPLAPRARLGFSTEHTSSGDWRVYSAVVGDNVVQLAQPMSVRSRLAAEVALRTLWPSLMLLPLLGVAVWLVIGRGLKPLRRVALALDTRQPDALDPLPDQRLPNEVQPLVRALNGLLERLAHALDTQRAFVADAAHELRTPLAALQIQVQLLERARNDAARREATADLKHGVERATRLVEQLLALARAEPGADCASAGAPVSLRAVVEDSVRAYTTLAAQRGVDLGMDGAADATVFGDPDALRMMIGNLVDNAVKYTPRGGRVDVSTDVDGAGRPRVQIVDTGPGIPAAERARVFDRFYRMPARDESLAQICGSGLGLAIVRGVAQQHGASLQLDDGPGGCGLRVSVTFTRHPGGTREASRPRCDGP